MNEIKRGFLKDYHRNGEPKTQEEKNREEFVMFISILDSIFLALALLAFLDVSGIW